MEQRPTTQRLHGMDALRAVAMLLGIVLHGTISYKVRHDPSTWPWDTQYHFIGYDWLYLFIHSFRMQLFYLVAGFFTRFLYLKIGEGPFIRHRIKRILLPFILSLIFLLPFSLAPFLYYNYMHNAHPWHDVARQLLRWNGMAHYWFLYYLLIFYVLMLGLIHLGTFVRIKALNALVRRISSLNLTRFGTVLFLVLPLTAIHFLFNTPMVEVYTGLFPRISFLIYYGYFFVIGWILQIQIVRLNDTSRLGWPCLILGVLLSFPMLTLINNQGSLIQELGGWYWLMVRLIGSLQTMMLVFGTLGLFMRYFKEESRTMRYISDSSYWLYLIHLGFVASLQILLFHSIVPGFLRFWLVMAITLLLSILSYDLLIRYTLIGDLLNGKRKRPQRHPTTAVTQSGDPHVNQSP